MIIFNTVIIVLQLLALFFMFYQAYKQYHMTIRITEDEYIRIKRIVSRYEEIKEYIEQEEAKC